MPNFIFPKLADSNQFEYMLRDLYNAMFPTATIDKYGRQGQKQHGVDITVQFQQCNCGAENEGQDHLWCIQCKNYDTLTVSDVDNILAACTFYKEVALFDKFIIATFAPRDVAVVKHLLSIRAQYPYAIEYAPQDTICDYLERNPAVFNKYYGSVIQIDPLKDKCLEIIVRYRLEAFIRVDPLTEGVHFRLPEFLEDCCAELQKLLDDNPIKKGTRLYGLIEQLCLTLDSYNSALGLMLFTQYYEVDGKQFIRFVPDFQSTDYHKNSEIALKYRECLMKLIEEIVKA